MNNREEYAQQSFELLTDQNQDIDHITKKPKNNSYEISQNLTDEQLSSLEHTLPQILETEKTLNNVLSTLTPDFLILKDYQSKKSEKLVKETQLADIKTLENKKKAGYIELKTKRLHEFHRGFKEISTSLKEMYRKITRGGDAELEFADSTDPFSEGIIFTVRPAHKS